MPSYYDENKNLLLQILLQRLDRPAPPEAETRLYQKGGCQGLGEGLSVKTCWESRYDLPGAL